MKTLGLETRLEPFVVSVNGAPVAVSNDVVLFSELEGKYGPQPSESKFPTVPVVIAIVIVAAIIAFVFIIRARKKKTA